VKLLSPSCRFAQSGAHWQFTLCFITGLRGEAAFALSPVRPIRGSPAIHPFASITRPRGKAALALSLRPIRGPLAIHPFASITRPRGKAALALSLCPIRGPLAIHPFASITRPRGKAALALSLRPIRGPLAIHPFASITGPALKRFTLFHPIKLCLLGTPACFARAFPVRSLGCPILAQQGCDSTTPERRAFRSMPPRSGAQQPRMARSASARMANPASARMASPPTKKDPKWGPAGELEDESLSNKYNNYSPSGIDGSVVFTGSGRSLRPS
jgi:hypothetical protein